MRPLVYAAAAVVTVATVAGLASAAISWTSTSSLHASVVPAPVSFAEGAGGANNRWIKDMEITENRTGFTATVKAKNGAASTISEVLLIENGGGSPAEVTLSADPLDNPWYEEFSWTVRNGGGGVATLDHLTRDPRATFTLPAGASYALDLRIDLADGAGKDSAQVSFGLEVGVS